MRNRDVLKVFWADKELSRLLASHMVCWLQGRLLHGAKNIDINATGFINQLQTLDKDKPLYIYCLAGGRSRKAAEVAVSNGFKEVYNIGIWRNFL